jgi:hypothetical protein
MPAWRAFTHPRLLARFRYPGATPQGSVDVNIEEQDSRLKVHVTSRASQDVYFEVTWIRGATVATLYEHLKARSQAAPEELVVGALQPAELGHKPASEFSLNQRGVARTMLLAQVGDDVCRVALDPGSPLNAKILATLTFD